MDGWTDELMDETRKRDEPYEPGGDPGGDPRPGDGAGDGDHEGPGDIPLVYHRGQPCRPKAN